MSCPCITRICVDPCTGAEVVTIVVPDEPIRVNRFVWPTMAPWLGDPATLDCTAEPSDGHDHGDSGGGGDVSAVLDGDELTITVGDETGVVTLTDLCVSNVGVSLVGQQLSVSVTDGCGTTVSAPVTLPGGGTGGDGGFNQMIALSLNASGQIVATVTDDAGSVSSAPLTLPTGGGGGCCNTAVTAAFNANGDLVVSITDDNGTISSAPASVPASGCCNTGVSLSFDANGDLIASVTDDNGTVSSAPVTLPTGGGGSTPNTAINLTFDANGDLIASVSDNNGTISSPPITLPTGGGGTTTPNTALTLSIDINGDLVASVSDADGTINSTPLVLPPDYAEFMWRAEDPDSGIGEVDVLEENVEKVESKTMHFDGEIVCVSVDLREWNNQFGPTQLPTPNHDGGVFTVWDVTNPTPTSFGSVVLPAGGDVETIAVNYPFSAGATFTLAVTATGTAPIPDPRVIVGFCQKKD